MPNLDLHDPVVVYVIIFLLSLLAAIVLFKVLVSRATIKKKGWSAGGAIAGFLIISWGSWNALRPELGWRRSVEPLSVPGGFKKISDTSGGIALAVPEDWHIDPPHCCPAKSRIDSTGCLDRVNRGGGPMLEEPVKWAPFQKA